jgi:hypothetical protein
VREIETNMMGQVTKGLDHLTLFDLALHGQRQDESLGHHNMG